MTAKEQFLSKRQRYQPISLPQHSSDEEMVRDWTLLEGDRQEIEKYRKDSRLYIAIQICAVRLYGRFLNQVHDLSSHIINYLGQQLDLPPSLTIEVPEREATYLEQRQNILKHLGFQRFDQNAQEQLEAWIEQQARLGSLPDQYISAGREPFVRQARTSTRTFGPGKTHHPRLLRCALTAF